MRLSLSTACLYHLPLSCAFRLAADAGFDGIELVVGAEVHLRGVRRVARLARAYGLEIFSLHQSLMDTMPFQRRERPMEEATRMALELDCPRVVIHGPYARSWDTPHARRWLQSLDACRRAIEGSSVRLALENPGLYSARDRDNVFAAPDDFARFCRDRDLSVTLDTCHAGTAGIDLMVACETLDGLLANVHLSDLATPHLLWDHHITRTLFAHHQMPGEGILPLAQMMGRLNLAGYQGPITMEISPFALRAWWGPLLRRRLGRLVAFYRDSLA